MEVTRVIARTLRVGDGRLEPTLDAVVGTASRVSGFDVGLALVEDGVLEPTATTSQAPHALDVLQREIGEGPCLEAATGQATVRVDDTRRDDRWSGFGRRAAELGVASMICTPLWIDDGLVGSLSLYAERPAAFSTTDAATGEICAALAAAAIADARRGEQLRDAISRRDLIGQAKGILVERHKITSEQAFELLAGTSQRLNRKLVVVARHLVETGELLGAR